MATDAVTLIMNDHRVLERLFEKLKAGNGDQRALVAEVKARLVAHSEAEETQVYPAIKDADPNEAEEVDHAYDEHEQADRLLMQVESAEPGSAAFDKALTAFIDAVKHHVEEEETEVLPALKEAVDGSTLERLGAAFEETRLATLAKAGIGDPDG
jgi:hemerythrin superfamily protein